MRRLILTLAALAALTLTGAGAASATDDPPVDNPISIPSGEVPIVVESTRTVAWLLPNDGTPDAVTWPQTLIPDLTACGTGWAQVDVYNTTTPEQAEAVDQIVADGILTGPQEDGSVYLEHSWTHLTPCDPGPWRSEPVLTYSLDCTMTLTTTTTVGVYPSAWDEASWSWLLSTTMSSEDVTSTTRTITPEEAASLGLPLATGCAPSPDVDKGDEVAPPATVTPVSATPVAPTVAAPALAETGPAEIAALSAVAALLIAAGIALVTLRRSRRTLP